MSPLRGLDFDLIVIHVLANVDEISADKAGEVVRLLFPWLTSLDGQHPNPGQQEHEREEATQ